MADIFIIKFLFIISLVLFSVYYNILWFVRKKVDDRFHISCPFFHHRSRIIIDNHTHQEEKYQILFPSFVKGVNGGIFMYDITQDESLNNIQKWLSFFKDDMAILHSYF